MLEGEAMMKKVIVNGKDFNNKQMRKTIELYIVHSDYVTERAFAIGFATVTSYRYYNSVSNEWMTQKL